MRSGSAACRGDSNFKFAADDLRGHEEMTMLLVLVAVAWRPPFLLPLVPAPASGRSAWCAMAALGRPGDWECPSCGASCFASRGSCFRCGEPRPGGGRPGEPRRLGRGSLPQQHAAMGGTRLFVSGLGPETQWWALKEHFTDAGLSVTYAKVSSEQDTGRSRGHGIVEFVSA